jgi:peptidoglycan-associated lipoprotein
MKLKTLCAGLLSVFVALTAVSCNKKNLKNDGLKNDMTTDTTANPALDVQGGDTMNTEGDIRGGEFVTYGTIQTVYFDFDKYGLSDEIRKALQKNAEILKAHKEWSVLVEGHCDSRGTVEYNLALGQKRAKEVRDYYTRLGVPESSIGTISYGKEKPVCEEETEDCWAKNRKAETKVKTK